MTRPSLSDATLGSLPDEVLRPAYERARTGLGVVHFGPGAFHRAHQAYFFDRMLGADPNLAVCAVSLRSDAVRQALAPQDGLYSLIEREAEPSIRVIGALREILTAPQEPQAVFQALTDPRLRYVTATVTEKGYGLTPGAELDVDHPDIAADLARPSEPRTLVGWLVEGLWRRRAAGSAAPVVLSCDNLSANGRKLGAAVHAFALARGEADLAAWIAGEVRFPDSMVDAITPATDDALRAEAAQRLGVEDAWPIQRERFCQWVIGEGLPGADRAVFEAAGVTLARDVAGFERAKLRLLNGAHSTLAYVGLLKGHATVAQAMADAELAGFVETLMRDDVAPTLGPLDMDVGGYIDAILARFRNPVIEHHLAQIAWDGSQKLPIRLLATIELGLAQGRDIRRLATGVAAWIAFVVRQAKLDAEIVDPLAQRLADLGRRASGEADADVALFLGLGEVFPRELAEREAFRAALSSAYREVSGPRKSPSGR
jgi:fructuronate reductase